MGDSFGGNSSANWADLAGIEFDKPEAMRDFAECGRIVAIHSADILRGCVDEIYLQLLAAEWAGGQSPENRARAKRALRPLRRTAQMSLPAAQKRFAQFPARLKAIYAEHIAQTRRSTGRRGVDPNF